jgi:hypothetical protein
MQTFRLARVYDNGLACDASPSIAVFGSFGRWCDIVVYGAYRGHRDRMVISILFDMVASVWIQWPYETGKRYLLFVETERNIQKLASKQASKTALTLTLALRSKLTCEKASVNGLILCGKPARMLMTVALMR